jgi:ActR/RegA family two-component response regulator
MVRPRTNPLFTEKKALVVHPDMGMISAFQGEFSKNGIVTVVARDLPTALLAMTQHFFDYAIVASRVSEEGDGWSVAGVLRLIFPHARLIAVSPRTDVLTLKSAINNGIDELCESNRSAEDIVALTVTAQGKPRSGYSGSVQ